MSRHGTPMWTRAQDAKVLVKVTAPGAKPRFEEYTGNTCAGLKRAVRKRYPRSTKLKFIMCFYVTR
jgi:hypothetical protein